MRYKDATINNPSSKRKGLFRRLFFRYLAPLYIFCFKRSLKIPRVQFIYFHHLFDDEVDGFERFLIDARKYFDIVSMEKALDVLENGNVKKPLLSISSDDGFKNNLGAARRLQDLGISACFFIPTKFVGVAEDTESMEIFNLKRMSFLSQSDLCELISRGHEIGNHTHNHPNLVMKKKDEIENEIDRANEELNEIVPAKNYFAYPYGSQNHHSIEALEYCLKLEMHYFSAIRGCHSYYPKDNIIRRDLVVFDNYSSNEFLFFMIRNARKI